MTVSILMYFRFRKSLILRIESRAWGSSKSVGDSDSDSLLRELPYEIMIHKVYWLPLSFVKDAVEIEKVAIFNMKSFVLKSILLLVLSSMLVALPKTNIYGSAQTGSYIYIMPDGSVACMHANGTVDPNTAPISSDDNITYTFTSDINSSLSVQRANIVVDGASFTLQGLGIGICLTVSNNVTVKNLRIRAFNQGIVIANISSRNSICGNNITNNDYAISLSGGSNNSISGNNIAANNHYGIMLGGSSNNSIHGNNITNNEVGIRLASSSNNSIYGNNITNNEYGIEFDDRSFSNSILYNNFANNTFQVLAYQPGWAYWDNGVEGNYWSDYEERYPDAEEMDGLGMWDTPYIMSNNDQDNYPLIEPSFKQLHILAINSSPVTGINFTAVGVPHTTPWSGIYSKGTSLDLTMPEHPAVGEAYYWSQWSDGFSNRSRTVTMDTDVTLSAYFSVRPVARFTYSPITPLVGEKVTFNASTSFHLEGDIESYHWDFDDGNISSTTNPTIPHIYEFSETYNVTLTVSDDEGFNSSSFSQMVLVKMSTSILISASAPSTFVGFAVNITGTLRDVYGNGLRNETVILYYTFSGIGTWTPITSDTTDSLGNYYVMWIPPATGYFAIKSEWAGNSTYLGTNDVTNLNIISYADEYVFSVESNSTVSSLAFNTTNWTLSFTASGPTGTKGYVKVTIAKSLVANVADIRVFLDGNQSQYSATSIDNSWLLTFNYLHSTHQVVVDLDIKIVPEFPTWTPMLLTIITLTVAIAIYKRRLLKTPNH